MKLFRKRSRHQANLGTYKPYEPWKELEKLKSTHMWDDVKEVEDSPCQVQLPQAYFEVKGGTRTIYWYNNYD